MPSAVEHQQAAQHGHLLADLEPARSRPPSPRRSPARRLMRIIGPPPSGARGPRPPRPSAPVLGDVDAQLLRVERDLAERIEQLDRRCEPLAQRFSAKPSTREAPPLSTMRSMRSFGGRRLEEVERLLDFEQHVLGHRAQHRPRVLVGHAVDVLPLLQFSAARTAGSAPSAPLRCRRCRPSRRRG